MERFTFDRLPEPARVAFSERFGRVLSAETAPAGLTVGVASTVTTTEATVFVKAIPRRSPAVSDYRRELTVARILPTAVPAPRLLWSSDAGWITLVYEHVKGTHVCLPADAEQVMASLVAIRGPLAGQGEALAPITGPGEKLGAILDIARVAAGDPPPGVPDVDQLVAALDVDPGVFSGDSLVHADPAPSNLLATGAGVLMVDWALSGRGPAWIDAALLVTPMIAAGVTPAEAEAWAARHPDWSAAPSEALDALAAGRLLFTAETARNGPSWLADGRRRSLWAHRAWAAHRGLIAQIP